MLRAAEQLGLDDRQIAALNRVYWASSSGRSGADLVREAASLLSPDQFREAVARFASEAAQDQGVATNADSGMTNLEATITAEINGRLKDRSVVEIELASKVADRLVGWAKTFGIFVAAPTGILLLIISLFGFYKFEDVRNAANRVDGLLQQATTRLDEGNTKLQQADRRVAEITELALQRAKDVDRQLATLRDATEKAEKQISNLGQSVQQIETRLGGLSSRFETSRGGPGTVASGAGGDRSYGTYQLSLRTGSLRQFLERPEFPWRDAFAGMEPGSPEFDAAWRALAEREPKRFAEEQRKYIQDTYFEPAARTLKEACGLDVKTRSNVLQDVIWSRAVQTGHSIPRVVQTCRSMRDAGQLDPSDKTLDERLIREIYGRLLQASMTTSPTTQLEQLFAGASKSNRRRR